MNLLSLFPRLLPGVLIQWEGDFLYLGYRHRGVELTCDLPGMTYPELAQLLLLCDGKASLGEMVTQLKTSQQAEIGSELRREEIISALADLLVELEKSGYLILDDQPRTNYSPTTSSDSTQASRIVPELNLARTPQSIANRSARSILIFGENRLAHHLTMLLRASGFGEVRRINRREVDRREVPEIDLRVTASEIIGLAFRQSDIGAMRRELIGELEAEVNIHRQHYPRKSKAGVDFPAIPSFIISTYETPPDYQYRWMNERIPHLLISSLSDHQIDLGPIVLPGSSACGRCIELSESEVNPIYRKSRLKEMHSTGVELSAATVSAIGGLITLEIIEFFHRCDQGLPAHALSSLQGRSKRIDLHNASSPVDIYWAPHPECGCTGFN